MWYTLTDDDVAQATQKQHLTEDELSRAAINEQFPETNASYDWLAWYKLRDVYRDFKAGRISKDLGEQRKRSIFQSRQNEIDFINGHWRMEKHVADLWKGIEEAGHAYMKEPTIEHADKFVEAVYGAGRLKRDRAETKTPSD